MCSSSQTPLPTRKTWTLEEDQLLTELRQKKAMDWIEVARHIEGRNPSQCAQRWKRIKGYKLRRQWSGEEDELLKKLVAQYGQHWSKISSFLQQRSGKQIREHYLNQLHPDLNNEPWATSEDEKIIEIYKRVGGRWSIIQKELKGRSENSIKNRFYSYLRNKYLNIQNPYYIVPSKKAKTEEIAVDAKLQDEISKNQNTPMTQTSYPQMMYAPHLMPQMMPYQMPMMPQMMNFHQMPYMMMPVYYYVQPPPPPPTAQKLN